MILFLVMLSLVDQGMHFHWILWTLISLEVLGEVGAFISGVLNWWFGDKKFTGHFTE